LIQFTFCRAVCFVQKGCRESDHKMKRKMFKICFSKNWRPESLGTFHLLITDFLLHKIKVALEILWSFCDLSWVATVVFNVRLLHAIALSKKLRWLAQTKVITLKTQLLAVNARWKRLSQRSLSGNLVLTMN